ncbi:MAG: hypothetical protein LUF81_05725 [Clostridiales bacterium]|nr:hypothetical protein [Clostridiales bacterium]
MEVNVRDNEKLVDVWLTNAEKNDPQIQAQLRELYAKYKDKKYLVAVYQSGSRDLYESTLALLAYNKKRVAELDVQREKRRQAATVER